MELLTLSPTTRMADKVVENYTSLIWNERYRDPGDFKLESESVDLIRTMLPLDSLVTLDDTKELMIVEDHMIDVNEQGNRTISVTGRTFESVLENRTTLVAGSEKLADDGDPTSYLDPVGGTAAKVAADIAMTKIPYIGTLRSPIDDADYDVIANVSLPTAIPTSIWRTVARGISYDEMIKWMDQSRLGIKCQKPNGSDAIPYIYLTIYNGRNRTATVIFDVKAGHFEGNVKYLWSTRNSKTGVHVSSKLLNTTVYNSGMSGYTDVKKRMGILDLPAVTKTSTQGLEILKAEGRAYLAKNKRTAMVDGKVSNNVPYKYNVHYFLGDLVRVVGEYGVKQDLYVTGYLRTKDKTGEYSYPTLGVLDTA